jgi:hypothetical protein
LTFPATRTGAKSRPAGTIFVDASGIWCTKPIRLKPDSIKDDDVTTV